MPPSSPHSTGLLASPPATLSGSSRRPSREPRPTSITTVIAVNRSVLWNASIRNKGRLAASPKLVSTSGMPSSTVLPKAAPKPVIARRSNEPPNQAPASPMPAPNTAATPR